MTTNNNIIVLLGLLCGASQAATYNYNLSSDNDYALYSSTGFGGGISNVVQHAQQDIEWFTPTSGSFITVGDYIHVIAMNYDSLGAFGGLINGFDISTIPWEVTGNTEAFLTGYPSSPSNNSDEIFNPEINNATMLMQILNFTGPAPLTGSTTGVSVSGVSNALDIPNSSVVIFRTEAANFAVPEPSSALLLGLSGFSILFRRRRS